MPLEQHISIHPPLAGRDCPAIGDLPCFLISIHPPLAGRDDYHRLQHQGLQISIHPPLAGRDRRDALQILSYGYFNPPAPCGAGPFAKRMRDDVGKFQSTRPLRGGTCIPSHLPKGQTISIHPPLAGRDPELMIKHRFHRDFNPPAPCGAGRFCLPPTTGKRHFNPPAPCGAGLSSRVFLGPEVYFNPPAPCGAGPPILIYCSTLQYFNPPAPCGAGQRSCTKKLCKTSHIAQKVHLPWPY